MQGLEQPRIVFDALTAPQLKCQAQEDEPRLKYARFESDVQRILEEQHATRLCVSDKILALGTAEGVVHVLDYDGNEASVGQSSLLAILPSGVRSLSLTLAAS
jgi:hypothetical protein